MSLAVDALNTHLGAVLQQLLESSWAELSFYSRKLSDAEKKYSAFDRELLAAYFSILHFRFMLEGSDLTIFTDHKPLLLCLECLHPGLPASSATSPTWLSSQAMWSMFLDLKTW